jgi:hypothetical protein
LVITLPGPAQSNGSANGLLGGGDMTFCSSSIENFMGPHLGSVIEDQILEMARQSLHECFQLLASSRRWLWSFKQWLSLALHKRAGIRDARAAFRPGDVSLQRS